jgi:hypothetical protein
MKEKILLLETTPSVSETFGSSCAGQRARHAMSLTRDRELNFDNIRWTRSTALQLLSMEAGLE